MPVSETFFIKRVFCPACNSKNSIELCNFSYTEAPIKDYLESFCYPQGGVDFEYLEDVNYVLHAKLIF